MPGSGKKLNTRIHSPMTHPLKRGVVSVVALLLLSCCAAPPTHTVTQVSTINALMTGVFDADVPCTTLLASGDFGIGTFDRLDGEMVVLDGVVYQVKADGRVCQADPAAKTPFATVCKFSKDTGDRLKCANKDYDGLKAVIDTDWPQHNLFYAIRVDGIFPVMKTRSVPAQQKPYPPLKDIAASQPEFTMTNVCGTLVGFRCPAFVKGINVPGYHLHFISSDRTQGGHVLGFALGEGTYRVDMCDTFVMMLPSANEAFLKADLASERAEDLKHVESKTQK